MFVRLVVSPTRHNVGRKLQDSRLSSMHIRSDYYGNQKLIIVLVPRAKSADAVVNLRMFDPP